jgi:hypothetical protein
MKTKSETSPAELPSDQATIQPATGADIERDEAAPAPEMRNRRIRSGVRAGSYTKKPPLSGEATTERGFGGPELPRRRRR